VDLHRKITTNDWAITITLFIEMRVRSTRDDRHHCVIIRSNESSPDLAKKRTRIGGVILRIPVAKLSCHLATVTCSGSTYLQSPCTCIGVRLYIIIVCTHRTTQQYMQKRFASTASTRTHRHRLRRRGNSRPPRCFLSM